MKTIRKIIAGILGLCVVFAIAKSFFWVHQFFHEKEMLAQIIDRLSADSRVAEVLVTESRFDEAMKIVHTTIKFLEYDAKGRALEPRYFTFEGNVIQFQTLVVRFEDKFVRAADKLRGKSAYLFLRAFVLDSKRVQVFDITQTNEVPNGYRLPGKTSEFERKLWEEFWTYALDPSARHRAGIKNAQIEAPGSLFLPGTIYTLRIEHSGGLRIDTQPVPEVLKGETLR